MKIKLEVALEHAVAFLSDPYVNDIAPVDIGEKPIAFTDNCVAFVVRPYFDGGAVITVSTDRPDDESNPVLKTSMNCESGVISLSDSRRFNYCLFPIEGKFVHIEIWKLKNDAEEVWIKLAPLSEY
jgi:hypothetical protein